MKINLYIGLLFVVLLSSCKKDDLPDVHSTDPVFYMDYSEDGQNHSIIAGDDNWELQTGISQLMGYEVNYGQFFNPKTSSYFRIDYLANSDFELSNDILHLSSAGLFSLPEKIIEKIIIDGNLANIQSIEWSINGAPYCLVDLTQIAEPGTYDICVKVSFAEGCVRELCNTFYLGVARDVHARYYVENINAVQKMCISNIQGNYDDVEWVLNGNTIATGNTLSLDSMQQGLYNLKMKVIKDGEVKSEWTTLIPVGNVLCDFKMFDIKSDLLEEITNGLVFSYLDESGDLFNSITVEQSNQLSISDIGRYVELNDAGQEVISFKLQGTVVLENLFGIQKTFELENVKMAVAI